MTIILLYLSDMFLFYIIGHKLIRDPEKFGFVSLATGAAIYLLIFTMGTCMGANEEIIAGLGSIGVQALITVLMALGGSIICALFARKILGLDRHGLKKGQTSGRTADEESGSGLKSSIITLTVVVIGMASGYFIVPLLFEDTETYRHIGSQAITVLLLILLASVGFSLGLEGDIQNKFRSIGFKVFAMPVSTIIGTLAMGVVYGLIGPYSMRESLAVFAGLGWYSFAPGVIMDAGYVTASAVSFLHNVFREVFSLLFIPLVADKIGYFEAVSMTASSGMDCCLASVKNNTNGEMVIYSVISGTSVALTIPILVPLILGL